MLTLSYDVDYPYTKAELTAIFSEARDRDVESGGRYDAGSASISVWTHPWTNEMLREESILIGTLHVSWAVRIGIWNILVERGFSFDDVLHELGILETHAFGSIKHGISSTRNG